MCCRRIFNYMGRCLWCIYVVVVEIIVIYLFCFSWFVLKNCISLSKISEIQFRSLKNWSRIAVLGCFGVLDIFLDIILKYLVFSLENVFRYVWGFKFCVSVNGVLGLEGWIEACGVVVGGIFGNFLLFDGLLFFFQICSCVRYCIVNLVKFNRCFVFQFIVNMFLDFMFQSWFVMSG